MATIPHGDWIAQTQDLPRRAGEMRPWKRTLPAPPDLGVSMIGVPEGATLNVDLTLESAGDGIWVSGTVTAPLVGQCVRCLTSIDDPRTFTIQELYYYPGKDAEEDALFVEYDRIDLEPALRDAVVLELPFSPLCRDDCAGLCPTCGADLNHDPDHTHGPAIDARWAALQGLADAPGGAGITA